MRPNRILVAVSRVVAVTPDRSRVAAVILVRSRAAVAILVRSRVAVAIRAETRVDSVLVAVAILDRSRAADDNPRPLMFSEPDEIVRLFFSLTLH